jgi:hypothetical protein
MTIGGGEWSDAQVAAIPAPLPTDLEAAQPLNRQSCDRDHNSSEEPADAAEHQNIVDFGHGIPRVMDAATVVQTRPSCNHLPAMGLGQS